MILVIGGAYQGKLEFAKELWKERQNGRNAVSFADGRSDSCEKAWNAQIIYGFHHFAERMTEEEIHEFIGDITNKNPASIIIMNEVGYGIVPADPKERAYREAAGHAGQRLAKEAKEIYRVVCGIGTKIK